MAGYTTLNRSKSMSRRHSPRRAAIVPTEHPSPRPLSQKPHSTTVFDHRKRFKRAARAALYNTTTTQSPHPTPRSLALFTFLLHHLSFDRGPSEATHLAAPAPFYLRHHPLLPRRCPPKRNPPRRHRDYRLRAHPRGKEVWGECETQGRGEVMD
ncbi:hypothetical protein K458DRAFT_414282 [Lentithecium fluviatile CBS 122367]|uniref:Uncharacterized protein n=1 Tax=Lentithecium fluviatile CBS 122367 TaxID=1168545 RepID=A0A6G1JEI7_9PLEO|nr:hypothetical protein K458DRAFT_414282 [Lentithecium fluviatile CBS 122367]